VSFKFHHLSNPHPSVFIPEFLAAHHVLFRSNDVKVLNANGTFLRIFLNFRSWSMMKQCVDATYQDIRKREVLSELQLRIIEVQCSAPVMWITPSKRISHGFPMMISRNSCPTMISPLTSGNEDTSPNHWGPHLSLYVTRAPPLLCHCAYITCL
jgi:hypothetical protein